ncbi:DNA-binding MarR family transcriptional regulator [Thermocatellispora tengchongensis]|uniref:DNA-binding MarR family transcriptional regulator n=1 Tax=Thermocatellispora tengchongensis TaxID=1073253 RepID=A0A840PCC6_9ACTN|nr:MarR family transcriptional regulator [Thermocatellispora tengchongensis]MBB5139074.1 DNA-binding MarR family transcriptional regulator [Thermocatellispora tengchongensis]
MNDQHVPHADSPSTAPWSMIEREAAALVAVWGRSRQAFATRISSVQLQALLTIEQHETVNLGRLAAALGAVPSSASRLCDRLEAAGLVRRSHREDDRRELTLALTPAGRALVEEMEQRRRADLIQVLDEMPQAGRIALLRGLQAFAAAADRIMDRQAEEPEDDWTSIASRLLA